MPNPSYQYSNGLDLSVVLPALRNRLKWLSEKASSASLSGRYFDDGSFHAAVSELSVRNLQPTAGISDNDFTAYKASLQDAAITRALQAVFDKFEVIENVVLYEVMRTRNVSALPTENFVGFEIDVANDLNKALRITNAILHFDSNTTFKLYCYAAGESSPFWEQSVTVTGGKYHVIVLTDCFISFRRFKTTKFYFGYKPSEVTGGAKPYQDDLSYPNTTCIFDAQPIKAALPLVDGSVVYPQRSDGLNLEIISFNDFTEKVTVNPDAMDELIGLSMAAMLIELSLFSVRKNPEQRASQENADRFALQLELTGTLPVSDAPQILGLRSRIKAQAKKTRESFIDRQYGVVSYEQCNY